MADLNQFLQLLMQRQNQMPGAMSGTGGSIPFDSPLAGGSQIDPRMRQPMPMPQQGAPPIQLPSSKNPVLYANQPAQPNPAPIESSIPMGMPQSMPATGGMQIPRRPLGPPPFVPERTPAPSPTRKPMIPQGTPNPNPQPQMRKPRSQFNRQTRAPMTY